MPAPTNECQVFVLRTDPIHCRYAKRVQFNEHAVEDIRLWPEEVTSRRNFESAATAGLITYHNSLILSLPLISSHRHSFLTNVNTRPSC